jgi:hypothetical protein
MSGRACEVVWEECKKKGEQCLIGPEVKASKWARMVCVPETVLFFPKESAPYYHQA